MLHYHAHWTLALAIVLVGAVGTGIAVPITTISQAMEYLQNYGYFSINHWNSSIEDLVTESTLEQAIMNFQRFARLNVTGKLDNETMQTMSFPRCVLKDKVEFGSGTRFKRYAFYGRRWNVTDLTYKITNYSKQLDRSTVDEQIAKAFGVWSDYSALNFRQKETGTVDTDITFVEKDHGDANPFDGPKGLLSHVYYPMYGGDVHFDDAEQWTVDTQKGVNLFQVAVHEIGHALGLYHSDVRSSVMSPFGHDYDPNFRLDSDDIEGIQALYGPPSLCNSTKIDAIFNDNVAETYVFKGDKYYKLMENAVAEGYPKKISDGWPGMPGNIDAAFTYKNGKTFFFRGNKYWQYQGRQVDGDYPKEINKGFTGVPDNLDAAMVWGGNGKIYFFKESQYWRFDPQQRPPVKSTYPKPISNWEGVPNNIDGAMEFSDCFTYFFKDDKYYQFNDTTFKVDQDAPSFQGLIAKRWFGC